MSHVFHVFPQDSPRCPEQLSADRTRALRQERAVLAALYPTTSRVVQGAPQMPPIGAAAVTTVEARGSASTRPAAVSRDRLGDSGPAPGAVLTRQGAQALAREGRQHGPSCSPATSAVSASGSRTDAAYNVMPPATRSTSGRPTGGDSSDDRTA